MKCPADLALFPRSKRKNNSDFRTSDLRIPHSEFRIPNSDRPLTSDFHKTRWLHFSILAIIAVALFYAPLAWGAATKATRLWLDYGLFAIAGIFLLSLLLEWRSPRVPMILLGLVEFLACLGWTHALNPKFEHLYLNWQFRPVPDAINFLPGTLDQKSTLEIVFHLSALGLAFFVRVDLAHRRSDRWFLLGAVALSGFVVALIGIYQKATLADSMLWTDQVYPNRRVFSPHFDITGMRQPSSISVGRPRLLCS